MKYWGGAEKSLQELKKYAIIVYDRINFVFKGDEKYGKKQN